MRSYKLLFSIAVACLIRKKTLKSKPTSLEHRLLVRVRMDSTVNSWLNFQKSVEVRLGYGG